MTELQLLENILKDSENSIQISHLLQTIQNLPKSSVKSLLNRIHSELFSSSKHSRKLQCIRLLKYLMLLKNQSVISRVNSKFILHFFSLFSFTKDHSRFNLWIESRKNREKSLFKFTILTLQCIESWSDCFQKDSKGNDSNFYEVFNGFREKNVEFPPSFFLKSLEPICKKDFKRDLVKVRSFCKEFEFLMNNKAVFKVKMLKKILFAYEKTLDVHLDSISSKNYQPDSYFIETLSRVKTNIFKFLLWKSSNFTELFDPKNKVYPIIPDPIPKSEPQIENSREANDDLSSSQSSLSDIEEILEDYDRKEGLNSMYKQDLFTLQDKYMKLTEEREMFLFKNSALDQQARDLQRLVEDQKKITLEFSRENEKLMKENQKLIEFNDFYDSKIKELNITLDKIEKSKINDIRLIENLENNNELLLLSNQNLKEEIEKLRNYQEKILDLLKEQNFSQDLIENTEMIKNSPNVSLGSVLNKSKNNQSSKSAAKLSSVDTLADYDGYDNENFFFDFVLKGNGPVFEDERIKITANFHCSGEICEGNLKLENKLEKNLKILVEICAIPKEFKRFSMPSGGFKLKKCEKCDFPVNLVSSKVFADFPMIKITYLSIYQSKFLKLPISFMMFFSKTENISTDQLRFSVQKVLNCSLSQWKLLKKSFSLYGKRIRNSKREEKRIETCFSSIFGNILVCILFDSGSLKISLQGNRKNIVCLTLQFFSMVISKILQNSLEVL